MLFLNPMTALPADVKNAAKDLVQRGGRVVVVMEHCKNGCWGNAAEDNALLGSLGSSLTFSGQGGAPLASTSLVVAPVPPLTDGVNQIVAFYSGSVDGGTALGTVSGGDRVIGYQRLGKGDTVAIADSSIFGYVMQSGDNRRFILNLGKPLP